MATTTTDLRAAVHTVEIGALTGPAYTTGLILQARLTKLLSKAPGAHAPADLNAVREAQTEFLAASEAYRERTSTTDLNRLTGDVINFYTHSPAWADDALTA